jgi:hypothetical protein
MATLVKPVVRFVSYLTSAASALWLVALLCDRLYQFNITYREAAAERANEDWLRENCRDPVFYSNLKSHSDLCSTVERNARRNLLFFSLNQVLAETYVCGATSCTEQAAAVVAWYFRLSTSLMLLVSAMAVLCPLVLVQLIRVVVEALRPPHQHHPGAFYAYAPPIEPQCLLLHNGARKRV